MSTHVRPRSRGEILGRLVMLLVLVGIGFWLVTDPPTFAASQPLIHEKGVYQGQKDAPLSEEALENLDLRHSEQSF